MADFNQSDLSLNHYKWEAKPDDDPSVTGAPDSTLFNRNQGYEVLYMLNKVLPSTASKADLHKAEKLIRDDLSSSTRSQEKVKVWLEEKM